MGSLFLGRIVCLLGAYAALSGCSAPQMLGALTPAVPSTALARGLQGGSWMLSDAKRHKLLYVSDPSANAVYVFTYPRGDLVGTLTGINQPWGLCSDNAGNVFVADVWNDRVLEYAHGGTTPIASLTDDHGHPTSCSVDPVTGDLAVVYYFLNRPHRFSEIAVYAGERGSPRRHYGSKIGHSLWWCAYDDRGNLFVDGLYGKASLIVGLAELPKDGLRLVNITLDTHIGRLSSLQWTGKYLAIGDQGQTSSTPATIYQLSVKGTTARKVGSTQLATAYGMQQFWVRHDKVSVASESTSNVFIYRYPAGGNPRKTISGVRNPFGVTVSRAH